MIVFDQVVKRYGDELAVDHATFSVERGELFGLIGPDGAGKSSIMRMLVTLVLPDDGAITFDGRDVVDDYRYVRSNVGYMPGNFSLYVDLTVEENLSFFARVFGTTIDENYHLIADIYDQLKPFKDRRAGALSGGMKQKLALCCALIHSPLVLILDEPTTGVDAVSRAEFWEMLRRLTDKGITILVSTPYLEEAALCDRVGLINNGRLMQIDTIDGIVASYDHHLWRVDADSNREIIEVLRSHPAANTVYPYRTSVMMSTDEKVDPAALERFLEDAGVKGARVSPATPDIEDRFMDLMMEHA
jgi:ABC-type multidrug transport system ATPase subunit